MNIGVVLYGSLAGGHAHASSMAGCPRRGTHSIYASATRVFIRQTGC
jgi:hypothetical protein